MNALASPTPAVERQTMEVDIVCVGFGPAMGGFLTTLANKLSDPRMAAALESRAMPGLPLQVVCYERADDIGFGVSGVATRGRAIRASLPDLDLNQLGMAAPVTNEKLVYLLDPHGASRRPRLMRLADRALRRLPRVRRDWAFELPYIPPFLRKDDGFVMSLGQFNQWVGARLMGTGAVQIWPATPVAAALTAEGRVHGVRLIDQGVDRRGRPEPGYLPGMDIVSRLTVVGDGPVGAVGQQLDRELGLPPDHERNDWAVGMKMVVDLPESCALEPGTVIHTLGYPEPELFGFLYVMPDRVASLGIFVPSWFDSPVRTSYRYLQHWMRHPYLWRHLEGGRLRSWGAKSLQESGRRGEPWLAGDGFARIGEGSGSTNVLTGSGVDEAWATGCQLAEAVAELWRAGKECTRANLEAAYVARRRRSWVDEESRIAERARDGFQRGFIPGLLGMALTGLTRGRLAWPGRSVPPHEGIAALEEFHAGRIPPDRIARIRRECRASGRPLHDALMDAAGWPPVEYDGRLLVSHQDALLLGGKVQAPAGYADHVVFPFPELCAECGAPVCVEICSGQAITPNPGGGAPLFDREKCVHCGACLWNCSQSFPEDPHRGLLVFRAGAGGLHSAEN